MIKVLKYLKPYLWQLILLIGLVYAQVMATLALPDYTAKIINEGIVLGNNDLILNTGLRMLVISLLGGAAMIAVGFLASRIAAGFSRDLRSSTFSKVESFSQVEFNKFSTASLITRTTNDIQQVQSVLIMLLRLALMAPIMGIGAIIKAYQLAPNMTYIMAISVGVLFVVIMVLFSIALPKFKILQKTVDKLNLISRQILTGIRVIRAFNNEKLEEEKFDKVNSDLTGLNLFVNRLMVVMQPVMMLVLNFTALAIIWIGSHMIDAGSLEIGNMIGFLQYSTQVIMSFLFLTIIFIMVPRASVSIDRISEVISTKASIKDPKKAKNSKNNYGEVEFKNVYFSYPGSDVPVLEDINFVAKSGKTTAFIGSTGSGKSTLINLIPRFYDVTKGQVLVDGVDIKDYKQEKLHSKIGYVPQKGILFSGTIESNIKYGKTNANNKQIELAAEVSQAKEFIDKMPRKFSSNISQGGTNVSGGQKQRLSIARALVRKPEIYIFDDSFSALDFKTDAKLRSELKKQTRRSTTLIVAQRISTVLNADNIIVLDEGKIVGQGTHKELLKSNKVYREIALSQLSANELNIRKKDEFDLSDNLNVEAK